jgi:nitrate/nitrite transporter NarK
MAQTKNATSSWLVLFLLILIGFTINAQQFCTPVMLPLMARDLGLNTIELGVIWGMATFGGLFLSLPGGILGDRVGPKSGIFIISIIAVLGFGLRGLAKGPVTLSIMMFIAGGFVGALPSVATKAILMWFPPDRVGLASGIWWSFNRIGMAAGAAISATVVAPAVHGWQNTFLLYGSILLVFALIWLTIIQEPTDENAVAGSSFIKLIKQVIHARDVWFCSIAIFGVIGSFVGFAGYLPFYLQSIGWTPVFSSLALTAFFLVTVPTSIIIPALSDRCRLRKMFFLVPATIYVLALGLIAVLKSAPVIWLFVIVGGLSMGCLLPVGNSMIAEIKGIGAKYAGTAISLGSALGGLGGLTFAWASGKLATYNGMLPFLFDAGLCCVCFVPIFFVREADKGR